LDDIQEKEKLKVTTGLNYTPVEKTEYSATKISFDRVITKELKLHIKIVLGSLQQDFRLYYRILTDKNEEIWIGFTDAQLNPGGYITQKENSQQIAQQKEIEYEFTDSILKTATERIEMMNNTKYKIFGKPYKLIALQFRGDPDMHDPIHYYYALE
jgi:hypothetical protein